MATTAGTPETGAGTTPTTPAGTETGQQEQQPQGQQQSTTTETVGQEQQPAGSTVDKDTKLPDDHPLVKKLDLQKTEISTLKQELAEARAQAGKATQLETDLGKRPTQEALDTLQKRYDRLEAFLQGAGGPLGKALDSRTFTKDLFETDKDIKDLVKEWNQANPTATSSALGAAAAAPSGSKPNMSDLLRAAAK